MTGGVGQLAYLAYASILAGVSAYALTGKGASVLVGLTVLVFGLGLTYDS